MDFEVMFKPPYIITTNYIKIQFSISEEIIKSWGKKTTIFIGFPLSRTWSEGMFSCFYLHIHFINIEEGNYFLVRGQMDLF
jgi:hypothetical protein